MLNAYFDVPVPPCGLVISGGGHRRAWIHGFGFNFGITSTAPFFSPLTHQNDAIIEIDSASRLFYFRDVRHRTRP